ncbi:MAG: sensor histidine kinase [Acidimicrobiia bacterium]
MLIALALVAAAVSASVLVRRSLSSNYEALLLDRVDEVELLIANGLLTAVIEPTGRETGQVQVIDAAGDVIAVTPGLATTTRLDVVDAPSTGREIGVTVDGSRVQGDPSDRYRLVARTVTSGIGPLTIYAVTSLRAADDAAHTLTVGLMIGVPLLTALAAALIWWVVGRALAPVEALRAAVDRIESTDLAERIVVPRSDDEIGRLGQTLNRMLGRLDAATTRQRVFAAAASHELRSPLSAIRTELEVGLAYPERSEWPLIANEALVEVSRLEQLARDLLVLTRLQATAIERVRCDLDVLVESELALRQPGAHVEYRSDIAPAAVPADRDSLVQLIRNLLDNAERHAGSSVAIEVGSDGESAWFVVRNDGPPIAPDDRARIFDPFTRLDDARALDDGGSGLGLAIAQGIVVGFDGTLAVMDLDVGAGFRVSFPAWR